MKIKGDIRISHLIGGIVAIFVLVVVIWGLSSFFGGQAFAFFDFIPGFNRSVGKVVGIEILRYDIGNAKVEYYDGTRWNNLDREVFLGDKKVKYEDVKRNFESFYYGTKRENNLIEIEQSISLIGVLNLVNGYNNNVIKIDKNLEDWSKSLGVLSFKSFVIYVPAGIATGYNKNLDVIFQRVGSVSCRECKSGDVRFQFMNRELSRGSPISFILGLGDQTKIMYADAKKLASIDVKGDFLTRMFNYMKDWRNSVFKKPIGINYVLDESGVLQYFCSELRDKRYIVVELSKGVNSDATC